MAYWMGDRCFWPKRCPPYLSRLQAGQPANHVGKIKYPQCKKGVWPPSDWDPRLAERSAQLPDIQLKLVGGCRRQSAGWQRSIIGAKLEQPKTEKVALE
jgi:hypothetical protein